MTTQAHKNTEITFPTVNDPHFSARINGKTVRAASLDAIKKRIDAAKLFEPFDAITRDRNKMDKWVTVRVIGIRKPVSRSSSPVFEIEGGHLAEWQEVYRPQDRAKIEELTRDAEKQTEIYYAAQEARSKIYEQMRNLRIKPTENG